MLVVVIYVTNVMSVTHKLISLVTLNWDVVSHYWLSNKKNVKFGNPPSLILSSICELGFLVSVSSPLLCL